MSLKAEIRNVAYEVLKRKESCTLEDVKNEVKKREKQIKDGNAVIRVTMSQIVKNDPTVRRLKRGYYAYDPEKENETEPELVTEKMKEVTNDMMSGIEQQLLQDVQNVRNFNWIQGTDEEVEAMRKKIKELKQVYLMLSQIFSEN